MAASHSSLASQLLHSLQTSKHLHPSAQWIPTFLPTQKPTTPLNALVSTAAFRLLASDITTTLDPTTCCLPPDVQNVNAKERRLPGPIVVQVLNVEDLGKSRWEQVEALEALERGEGTKVREVIRVAAPTAGTEAEEGEGGGGAALETAATAAAKSAGPHKLLLQDARGGVVYGFELGRVQGVSLGMNIGLKMELRNVVVARGLVLLEPKSVVLLGGKIEAAHKTWREGRKAQLLAAVEGARDE